MSDNSCDKLCNIDNYNACNIGKRIKDTAYIRNITLKELTTRAGVSVNVVQQMSAYGKMPRADILARIADVLAVSVDSLLDRAAPTTTTTTTTNATNADNAPPDLNAAISTVAAAANLSPDYIRGILHLPPNGSSTDNDI